MKKRFLLALTSLFLLPACGESMPIDQEGANVFPSSAIEDSMAITMGDVMPFYDNGTMNIYHLRNVTGSNSLFYHPIARLTTKDYIHYEDKGIALNYVEKIESVDAALGTGSFIKAPDGTYHCFYTGHNDKATDEDLKDAGMPHKEVIRHATSVDGQESWQKEEDFLLYGYEDDFRDPYVYFDKIDNRYYMLITSRDFGNAVIRRYGAASLSAKWDEWTFVDNFFTNDAGNYNMECPSYVEWNGYYYLAYSEQGDNRVTHYRYRTSHDGEWKKFERDALDSAGFYAGRLEKAEDKLYAFAWCARLTGGSTGSFDWAGNLVTHELVQKENGELATVMPKSYKDYFNHPVSYVTSAGNEQASYVFEKEKFTATALSKLSDNVTRLSFSFTAKEKGGNFGLTYGLDRQYDKRLGDGMIAFDLDKGEIACYNNVSNILRYGNALTTLSYPFALNTAYHVDLIMDDEIVSVYLNGEVAMTARLVNMEGNYFGFYGNKANAEIKEVAFYE